MATKKARYLRKGDIIKYTSGDREVEEVVRDVEIFLIMANGENVPLQPTVDVEVIPQEEIEPSITGETDD